MYYSECRLIPLDTTFHYTSECYLSPNPRIQHKCWKITPIVTEIKSRFKLYALLTPICSVDESMIKYCGKYGQLIKQHMPQKPIRFGYKVSSA